MERGNRFLEYLTKNVLKIGSVLGALTLIVATAYSIDGRWVQQKVYAGEMAEIQIRQLQFEERQTQQSIYDIEDRLANPRLPDKRRGIYEQRLRGLKQDLVEIEDAKAAIRKKGE